MEVNQVLLLHHPSVDVNFVCEELGVVSDDTRRYLDIRTRYYKARIAFVELTSSDEFGKFWDDERAKSELSFVLIHNTQNVESLGFLESLLLDHFEVFHGDPEYNSDMRACLVVDSELDFDLRTELVDELVVKFQNHYIELIEYNESTGKKDEASLSLLSSVESTGIARLYEILQTNMWKDCEIEGDKKGEKGNTGEVESALEKVISGLGSMISPVEAPEDAEATEMADENHDQFASEYEEFVGLGQKFNELRETLSTCDDGVRREAAARVATLFCDLIEEGSSSD